MPDPTQFKVAVYTPHDEPADATTAHDAAEARLKELIRDHGLVIEPATVAQIASLDVDVPRAGDDVPYRKHTGPGHGDGAVTTWVADGHSPVQEKPDLTWAVQDGDTTRWVQLPPAATEAGGEWRIRHGFGVNPDRVTVHAFTARGEPIGYELAAGLDEDTTLVLLVPGATTLHVTVDPEETP